jgi:hypothetical protein
MVSIPILRLMAVVPFLVAEGAIFTESRCRLQESDGSPGGSPSREPPSPAALLPFATQQRSGYGSAMIIDCHARVFAAPRLRPRPETTTFMSAEQQIAVMNAKGVDKAVIPPLCNPEGSARPCDALASHGPPVRPTSPLRSPSRYW